MVEVQHALDGNRRLLPRLWPLLLLRPWLILLLRGPDLDCPRLESLRRRLSVS